MPKESKAAKQERIGAACNWHCVYCGSEVTFGLWDYERYRHGGTPDQRATIDHVMPLCRGGEDTPANQVLACASCNGSKGKRTLEEWLEAESCSIPRWRSFGFLFAPTQLAA